MKNDEFIHYFKHFVIIDLFWKTIFISLFKKYWTFVDENEQFIKTHYFEQFLGLFRSILTSFVAE